jgi:hypothetical protein
MRAGAISIIVLSSAVPFAAQAAPLAPRPAGAAPVVFASANPDDFYGRARVADNTPLLPVPGAHYVAHASGLDRIDPGNMTVLGGQIGGNGVKGGAVVSLTWPTEH